MNTPQPGSGPGLPPERAAAAFLASVEAEVRASGRRAGVAAGEEVVALLPTLDDQDIVIVGAGIMGSIISSALVLGGPRSISLIDTNQATLDTLRARHIAELQASGLKPEEQERVLSRFKYICGEVGQGGDVDQSLSEAHLVIEAIPEVYELKRDLFEKLDRLCSSRAVLASNSSFMPISSIVEGLSGAGRCCNMHFLQRGISAVEIMGGPETRPQVIAYAEAVLRHANMVPVVLPKENVGFTLNVIWHEIKKGVLQQVAAGVTTPEQFDRSWMITWRTTIGPFGMMDAVGLKTVWKIEKEYASRSGRPEDEPPSFLDEMIADGRTGRSSAKGGFYNYPKPRYRDIDFLVNPGTLTAGAKVSPVREVLIQQSWRLKRFAMVDEQGQAFHHPMGEDVTGTLVYGLDGSVAVHLTRPNRAAFASPDPLAGTEAEKAAAFGSTFFYFGSATVLPGRILHKIDTCSFPNWNGSVQERYAELKDGLLVLSTAEMEVAGKSGRLVLEWEPKQ